MLCCIVSKYEYISGETAVYIPRSLCSQSFCLGFVCSCIDGLDRTEQCLNRQAGSGTEPRVVGPDSVVISFIAQYNTLLYCVYSFRQFKHRHQGAALWDRAPYFQMVHNMPSRLNNVSVCHSVGANWDHNGSVSFLFTFCD